MLRFQLLPMLGLMLLSLLQLHYCKCCCKRYCIINSQFSVLIPPEYQASANAALFHHSFSSSDPILDAPSSMIATIFVAITVIIFTVIPPVQLPFPLLALLLSLHLNFNCSSLLGQLSMQRC